MPTISLPKTLSRSGNLVAVPLATYAEFIAWQKKVKSRKIFAPTAAERKAFIRARRNYRRGKYVTLEALEHELDGRR